MPKGHEEYLMFFEDKKFMKKEIELFGEESTTTIGIKIRG